MKLISAQHAPKTLPDNGRIKLKMRTFLTFRETCCMGRKITRSDVFHSNKKYYLCITQ